MREPGPSHPITIAPHPGRVVVRYAGRTIVDTTDALAMKEGASPPVLYLPRADADMALLETSARRTTCPYKGEASYLTIRVDDAVAANVIWSYETPYPAVAAIAGRLAFYADRVDIDANAG